MEQPKLYLVTRRADAPVPVVVMTTQYSKRIIRNGESVKVRLLESEVRQLTGDGYRVDALPVAAPKTNKAKAGAEAQTQDQGGLTDGHHRPTFPRGRDGRCLPPAGTYRYPDT